MRSSLVLAALLIALLIAVAYYVGLVSDVNAVGGNLLSIFNGLSGRNSAGNFANYPTGG